MGRLIGAMADNMIAQAFFTFLAQDIRTSIIF